LIRSEHQLHSDCSTVDSDLLYETERDDIAAEAGILHTLQCFLDLLLGDWHARLRYRDLAHEQTVGILRSVPHASCSGASAKRYLFSEVFALKPTRTDPHLISKVSAGKEPGVLGLEARSCPEGTWEISRWCKPPVTHTKMP